MDTEWCLGFVFENWLDPETFTEHGAAEFALGDVRVRQGRFLHTKEEDHTGAVVWDDAVMTLRMLSEGDGEGAAFRAPRAARVTVLDLGCGTGFLGIAVAAACGADVVVSDQACMRPLAEANVEVNTRAVAARGGRCRFLEHSWGEPLGSELAQCVPFDVILASGCVYHEEASPLLVASIKRLSGPHTVVYVAIDFRFDLSRRGSSVAAADSGAAEGDQDDEHYVSPVIRGFLEQCERGGLRMAALDSLQIGLQREHVKDSVRVYRATVRSPSPPLA